MAYNLSRNSRIFVTTNLSTASGQTVFTSTGTGTSTKPGQVLSTGFTANNTFEVQVLDGFSFTQQTQQQTIQINEASDAPIRGQRSFNTALDPVDISFSTYARPRLASSYVTAEERVLWNALLGDVGITGTLQNGSTVTSISLASSGTLVSATVTAGAATFIGSASLSSSITAGGVYTITGVHAGATHGETWNAPVKVTSRSGTTLICQYLTAPTGGTVVVGGNTSDIKLHKCPWVEVLGHTDGPTSSFSLVTTGHSNKNQLQQLAFIFVIDGATYIVEDCVMDSATLDFGLDAIASIAWSAKGTRVFQLSSNIVVTDAGATVTLSGGLTGTATARVTTANYITNKLSTVTLKSELGGTGTSYSVVMTGGSLTISNNITYITPQNLGVLNTPVAYTTGSRSISGNITAYLKTGAGVNGTGALIDKVLEEALASAETKYRLIVQVGGINAGTRIEYDVSGCSLTVPTIEIADLVSTSIAFTAQGTNGLTSSSAVYDIEGTNDLFIRYYSV